LIDFSNMVPGGKVHSVVVAIEQMDDKISAGRFASRLANNRDAFFEGYQTIPGAEQRHRRDT